MNALYTLSLWLHIVAAGVWIGSMVFLGAAVTPALRRPDPDYERVAPRLLEEIGLRYRAVGWGSLALLLLTGIFNLGLRGYGWADLWEGTLFAGPFGQALRWKLGWVALLVAITLWHDVRVGPRAAALLRSPPPDPEAHRRERERLRRLAAGMGWAMLLLSLAIAYWGVLLARGGFL